MPPADDETPTLADLYPDLTEDELLQAEENLARYVRLVWRLCERSTEDQKF